MTPTKKNILYMLKESNAIEGVYDKASISCARRAFEYMLKYDGIHPTIIKYAHKLLMKNQDIDDHFRGNWRDVPVYIGGTRKDQPPLVIDQLMKDLCHMINKGELSPIEAHIQFENIHPFIDGNGRIGRMILNWQLIKLGQDMRVFTESGRQDYYELFRRPQSGNDLSTS